MNKNIWIAIAIVLAGGIAAYLYLQQGEQEAPPAPVQVKPVAPPPPPAPAPVPTPAPEPTPSPAPAPEVQPTVPVQKAPALPKLSESDKFMLDIIAGMVNDNTLMEYFHTKRVIRNIVATVDNLPRERAPVKVMPMEYVRGLLITEGDENNLTISPRNAERYAPYMKIADAIDVKKLAAVYVRLYPLFQEAYKDLGYPGQSFNDRLLEVIDDLLNAPDLTTPITLVQPHVLYEYAVPELEACSAGQKILMRIGSDNEAKIKAKLIAFRKQVVLQMK